MNELPHLLHEFPRNKTTNNHSDLRQILTKCNMNYQKHIAFLLDLDKEELHMAEFKHNSISVWNRFRLVSIFHIYLA